MAKYTSTGFARLSGQAHPNSIFSKYLKTEEDKEKFWAWWQEMEGKDKSMEDWYRETFV